MQSDLKMRLAFISHIVENALNDRTATDADLRAALAIVADEASFGACIPVTSRADRTPADMAREVVRCWARIDDD